MSAAGATALVPRLAVIDRLEIAPDGATVAAAAGGVVCLFDAATGDVRWWTLLDAGCAQTLAFAADGRTLWAGGRDGVAACYDVATGAERDRLALGVGPIRSLSVAAVGTTAAACGAGDAAVVWDVDT